MHSPVIIVDPRSAGVALAPAFNARGIPVIAITLKISDWNGFGSKINASDFIEVIAEQSNLVEILRPYNPLAIIPGTEEGILLADYLTEMLMPSLANDPKKASHRLHKALMQKSLEEAGIPFLKTLNTASAHDAATWIKENHFTHSPLIVKPPISAGSDKVFHIPKNGDWEKAFNIILNEPSQTTEKPNETVVIQEQAIGTEYAVGTVSVKGKHYLTHLIKYNKILFNARETVYDYVEFVAYDEQVHGELFRYTEKVLDALGIYWGAAHTEIMQTKKGPFLIETGARMCGGPVVHFSREASGSSQVDKLVELYVDGDIKEKIYILNKTVVPVFLKSPMKGVISNVEAFEGVSTLSTFFQKYIWFKSGDIVPQTVDYLTAIGIVALAGDRESILRDYDKVRTMESQLIVQADKVLA